MTHPSPPIIEPPADATTRGRNIADVMTRGHGLGESIHPNMAKTTYFAQTAMNFSTIKLGFDGPFDFDPTIVRDAYEGHRPAPSQSLQDSYDRGTLAQLILQQPDEVALRIAAWDGGVRHGHRWDDFEAANEGKLIMKAADVREVQEACRAFRDIPDVRSLLQPCWAEISVFGKQEGIFVKGMLDAVTKSGKCVMFDIKTSRQGLSKEATDRTIRKLAYREQMGWYTHLWNAATERKIEEASLIFISLPPQRLGVRIKTLDDEALKWGAERVLFALRSLRDCIEADYWPTFFARDSVGVADYEMGDIEIEGIE